MALERVYGPLVGPRRDDLRAALIASVLHNVNRGPRDKATSAEDYELKFVGRAEPEDAEAILERMVKPKG
jgi:uncharacterized protein DUF4035